MKIANKQSMVHGFVSCFYFIPKKFALSVPLFFPPLVAAVFFSLFLSAISARLLQINSHHTLLSLCSLNVFVHSMCCANSRNKMNEKFVHCINKNKISYYLRVSGPFWINSLSSIILSIFCLCISMWME